MCVKYNSDGRLCGRRYTLWKNASSSIGNFRVIHSLDKTPNLQLVLTHYLGKERIGYRTKEGPKYVVARGMEEEEEMMMGGGGDGCC